MENRFVPTESSIRNLGQRWPAFIYRNVILAWEAGLKDADFANLRSSHIQELERSMGLMRLAFNNAPDCDSYLKENASELPEAYICFSTNKKSQSAMMFQHLRNAFAHAHFEYDGKWFELFTQTNKKKLKMKARIRGDHLSDLVRALRKGAVSKSGELL